MERLLVRMPPNLKIDIAQGTAIGHRPDRYLKFAAVQRDVVTMDVDDGERMRLERLGAVFYENVQFDVLPAHGDDASDEDEDDPQFRGWSSAGGGDDIDRRSLSDVLEQIEAPAAWAQTRGEGVTIAVVDTGVAGGLREVGSGRRSPIDLQTDFVGHHWTDAAGHGSMCAAIAAGSRRDGGRYDGVAPAATVISARSSLRSDDLFSIYDELVRLRFEGTLTGPLVVTNSYGMYVCSSPAILPIDHPFLGAILEAIDQGIFVCFAAGNNHAEVKCNHDPLACGPNSIWGPNSHDRVVSVGTVNRDLTNCDPLTPHRNSSRGPGEWAELFKKPDCVAPTYGEVPWGTTYRRMGWWGTSGACPQVAGLAALILSVYPQMGPDDVAAVIRNSCIPLPEGRSCVGHGLINCDAAVSHAIQLRGTM